MTSKAKYLLLGSTLLALSGYSLGNTSEEQSTQASNSHAIVTGIYSTDREIHAEVLRRIGEKPALATENIDVQTFDHDVYLYGSVTSRKDSEQAEAIARTVPGVRKVYNSLGLFGG
jgi:osmotically-inducible protein OsmY